MTFPLMSVHIILVRFMVAEWPLFWKEVLTGLTIFSLCILTIYNFSFFSPVLVFRRDLGSDCSVYHTLSFRVGVHCAYYLFLKTKHLSPAIYYVSVRYKSYSSAALTENLLGPKIYRMILFNQFHIFVTVHKSRPEIGLKVQCHKCCNFLVRYRKILTFLFSRKSNK